MSDAPHEQAMLDEIAAVLSDLGGSVYLGEVGPETRFFADLGLASIDAVVLGERLEERFGCKLPFG